MILPLTLRCSSADRTFSCNGSLLAVPLVPERTDDDGVEGSLLHFLIAKRLVTELKAVAPDGLVAPALPKGYRLPAFSAWVVDWAVNWVRQNIPADWSLEVEVGMAYRYELPRPVWVPVSEITGPIPEGFVVKDGRVLIDHFILSGHHDLVATSPDGLRSHGADWKTGPIGADPAESNWQVAGYLGQEKRAWPDLEHAKFSLCQPKIDEEASGIPRITETEMDGATLVAMNETIAERMNRALENRYETDSSMKACRYCPVGWRCPSIKAEKEFMKANLTDATLAELRAAPNDALLGDFFISARTLDAPIKAATELLHERIDAQGYLDSGSGVRITRTERPGAIEIEDPVAFHHALVAVLPDENRRALCVKPSKTAIIDQIAEDRGVPAKSKKGGDATSVYAEQLAPLTTQKTSRILVFT